MRIFLIRHGETPWTLSGRHTGKTDVELTEQGKLDAQNLRIRLQNCRFEKILCSPSKRAQETCKLAGFFHEAAIIPDLAEWDYGRYEGLTTAEILMQDPLWTIFTKGAPEGESVADVTARAKRILHLLANNQGDVALFSSGHFLRALTAVWLQWTAAEGRHFALFPASLSILGYERDSPALFLWNSISSKIEKDAIQRSL